MRRHYARLWRLVGDLSGAPADALTAWFSQGMLINVIAAIDDARTLDEFNALICGGLGAME